MDPASVTQLAIHICPSTSPPAVTDRTRGEELLHAAYRASGPCPPAFGGSPPLSAKFRRASATVRGLSPRPNGVRPVVEVNGIEPMTSCLQSRRSPS